MRVACLVSGGKDSLLASLVVHNWGWDIVAFVTLVPEAGAPHLFHRPNAQWVRLQAEAVGVPWRSRPLAPDEDEEQGLTEALRGVGADGIVSGALASEYQRTRFERVAHGLGLKSFSPLWHHRPVQHLVDLAGSGIASQLVHVSADGLDASWLGQTLDEQGRARLAKVARIHPAGEGGEYETFVTDAPHFSRPIEILRTRVEQDGAAATLVIEDARLAAQAARLKRASA